MFNEWTLVGLTAVAMYLACVATIELLAFFGILS